MIHRLRHSRHKVPVGCWDDLSQSESFLHRHWANSIMGRSLVLFPLVLLLVFCMETTVANLQEISVTHLDPFQLGTVDFHVHLVHYLFNISYTYN